MTHWRKSHATGDRDLRGDSPDRPHTASADAGSNVIKLADYRHPSLTDGQPNSERLTAAPLFIPASFVREFAAWCFIILFVNIPGIAVLASIFLYAAFIAKPGEN